MIRRVIASLILGVLLLVLACSRPTPKAELLAKISPVYYEVDQLLSDEQVQEIIQKAQVFEVEPVAENEIAVMETNLGVIKFEFFPQVAPNHCKNFKKLANSGFYNGTTFHRVIPDFMIQGGDILSRDSTRMNDGTGGPGYNIDAEFNDISHEPGIVSTARSQDPNSAGSQFFICDSKRPYLDGKYTVFGKVFEGLEIVKKIINVDRDPVTNNPYQRVFMKRVYVIPRTSDF
jgi:cyclophilin family peptidyl-prolyl cis-trans isomerase